MLSTFAFVVVIVIDQLRPDQLYPSSGMLQAAGGLSQISRYGLVYEDAHQDNFFNMTCPGHTAISTGAMPALTGVVLNRDWDYERREKRYCLADPDHVWLEAEEESMDFGEAGTSPKRILTTTLGDELKMRWPQDSAVVSVALKDRAAIPMGGHIADTVVWFALGSKKWTTSTYYQKDKQLPSWLKDFNQKRKFEKDYEGTTQAIVDTTDLAISAGKQARLGSHKRPDILWVSYSTHDAVSHGTGDDLSAMSKIIKAEDLQIARLLIELKKWAGRKKFLVVLTSDHGNAINTATAAQKRILGGQLNYKNVLEKVNECMEDKGFSKKQDRPVVPFVYSMNFFLDKDYVGKEKASQSLKECVAEYRSSTLYALTKSEILENRIPQVPWLKDLAASLPSTTGADVVGVLRPYWNSHDKNPVNHETPFVHDSHVPLMFWWPGSKHKSVTKRVSVLDLAPTLSRLLEVRRPSGSTGELLGDVLDNTRRP